MLLEHAFEVALVLLCVGYFDERTDEFQGLQGAAEWEVVLKRMEENAS